MTRSAIMQVAVRACASLPPPFYICTHTLRILDIFFHGVPRPAEIGENPRGDFADEAFVPSKQLVHIFKGRRICRRWPLVSFQCAAFGIGEAQSSLGNKSKPMRKRKKSDNLSGGYNTRIACVRFSSGSGRGLRRSPF